MKLCDGRFQIYRIKRADSPFSPPTSINFTPYSTMEHDYFAGDLLCYPQALPYLFGFISLFFNYLHHFCFCVIAPTLLYQCLCLQSRGPRFLGAYFDSLGSVFVRRLAWCNKVFDYLVLCLHQVLWSTLEIKLNSSL